MDDLANDFIKGNNNYPTTVVESYKYITNFRVVPHTNRRPSLKATL